MEKNRKLTSGGGRLWIEKAVTKSLSPIASLDYKYGIKGHYSSLLRWQIVNNQFYCVDYSVGLDNCESDTRFGFINNVPLFAIELVNCYKDHPDFFEKQYEWRYRQLIENGPGLNPVDTATSKKKPSEIKDIYFDFWCRGDRQYEVYFSEPLQDNRLTRSDYFHEKKVLPESVHDPYSLWETINTWTFDWTGPFYVTATGDERFFVTDKGRVYTPPKGAKPGALLKEIWKGAPVDALIHDSDHKKWYAFTKDQYFEVADPIKPKPHSLTIRRSWFAEPALETAAKCGRVIRGLPEPK